MPPGPPKPASTNLTKPPAQNQADLPHERDETVGMTGGIPDETARQGHRDLTRGIEDTSRSAQADAAYRKLKK